MITKPAQGEYLSYYERYINQVPASGPVAALEAQRGAIESLGAVGEDKGNHRYADGKWTVKGVLGHLADAERVFGYRLLRAARADRAPIAGFDENQWAKDAPHDRRSLHEIVSEMLAVRAATLALVGSLDEEALGRSVEANGANVSARALCWILAGHTEHHLAILRERYGI